MDRRWMQTSGATKHNRGTANRNQCTSDGCFNPVRGLHFVE